MKSALYRDCLDFAGGGEIENAFVRAIQEFQNGVHIAGIRVDAAKTGSDLRYIGKRNDASSPTNSHTFSDGFFLLVV
ncbi:MAG: hypothetical protein FWD61_10060 [Phycisphaerales bacterium]|nr:hypothetical protein [Phycisphaerales bacterium]